MRVVLDLALCDGNTLCAAVAPELFEIGEDDKAHLILEGDLGPEFSSQVHQAISMCPMRAISVAEE